LPFWGETQPTTVLDPGKLNVTILETINHFGAPFRISLSIFSDNNYDSYILLDQFPHNNFTDGYDFDHPKPYLLEINIPNIDCPRCSLQVLSIMTDKLAPVLSCCSYPQTLPGNSRCFSVYHSCANVVIKGTIPPDQYQHEYRGPCGPYNVNALPYVFLPEQNTWVIKDPNYVPLLVNTCTGWNRTCVITTEPDALLTFQTGSSYSSINSFTISLFISFLMLKLFY